MWPIRAKISGDGRREGKTQPDDNPMSDVNDDRLNPLIRRNRRWSVKRSSLVIWFVGTCAAILLYCWAGSSLAIAAEQNVPLPEYTISESLSSDPPETKELLGKWKGNWDGKMDSILVITEIDVAQRRARVIYAWSDAPAWNTKKGYNQVMAEYVPGDKPIIKWGEQAGLNLILR